MDDKKLTEISSMSHSRVTIVSSDEEQMNESDGGEHKQLLSSPQSQEKDYESINQYDSYMDDENDDDIPKKDSILYCNAMCLWFITGVISNLLAITFLSMRVANPTKFSYGLEKGAHLGIFISMAIIGIILMSIGYALMEHSASKAIVKNKDRGKKSTKVSITCCSIPCALFTIGAILNAVAIDFLSLRVANPQQFNLGLGKGAHIGIFASMAIIGIALMGVGYFLEKHIAHNPYRTVTSPNQPEEEETDSLYPESPIEHQAKISNIDEDVKEKVTVDDENDIHDLQTSILNLSTN